MEEAKGRRNARIDQIESVDQSVRNEQTAFIGLIGFVLDQINRTGVLTKTEHWRHSIDSRRKTISEQLQLESVARYRYKRRHRTRGEVTRTENSQITSSLHHRIMTSKDDLFGRRNRFGTLLEQPTRTPK